MARIWKALTVCQPYAELIARGDKPIENRTWATNYRGPLLIHAGKSRSWMDPDDEDAYPGMVFGAVVAATRLDECLHINRLWPEPWARFQDHEHANGPFCLLVPRVRRLKTPIPWKGERGLWTPPAELVALVEAQLPQQGASQP